MNAWKTVEQIAALLRRTYGLIIQPFPEFSLAPISTDHPLISIETRLSVCKHVKKPLLTQAGIIHIHSPRETRHLCKPTRLQYIVFFLKSDLCTTSCLGMV